MTRNAAEPGNPDLDLDPYSNSSGSKQDAKENDALENLKAIANYNQGALRNKFTHGYDMYNISDQQAKTLADTQTQQNKTNVGEDWFEQMKKFQSTADKLKQSAGGSFTGSNLYNFLDLLGRENDSIRSESLNTQRKNQNEINNDLYEALAQNVNARNELAADTEYGLANILSDWAAQSTSVAPDKFKATGAIAGDQGQGAGTINAQPWLTPDGFYDQNKVGPAEITKQGLYTEDNAQKKANELQNNSKNTSSATNPKYWEDLFKGYNKKY